MDKLKKVIKGLDCCTGTAVHLGHCPEGCPYFAESERADKCVEKLHNDALELLKALEEKKARLIPLEEVKEGNWDYVYLEQEIIPASKEITAFTGFRHRVSCVTWPSITAMKISPGEKEYGRKWRCWTERPTDEQRKETPWAE